MFTRGHRFLGQIKAEDYDKKFRLLHPTGSFDILRGIGVFVVFRVFTSGAAFLRVSTAFFGIIIDSVSGISFNGDSFFGTFGGFGEFFEFF